MKYSYIYLIIIFLSGTVVLSCKKNLLDQKHTTEVPASVFWKTEEDAHTALIGAYASARDVFDRDYLFDGSGEYVRSRGSQSVLVGTPYYTANNYAPIGFGDKWDNYYKGLYGLVNRANYVINNVEKMLSAAQPAVVTRLERVIGEAKLLRGLAYFRLISMWGDVPYYTNILESLGQADTLSRAPIATVKDGILTDLNYAVEKLPAISENYIHAAKPAALALRGKVNLFWGSWKKNGWPELEGFQQNTGEATAAFEAATKDFKSVVNDFTLTLYKNGDPGGSNILGAADNLPNYYHLFTPKANGNPENLLVFTHGGGNLTTYGESLMRDFGTRSHQGSQLWLHPRLSIIDRYQQVSTGDFAQPLIPMPPTGNGRTTVNSAVNPQSYAGRDYRMKASVVWDYEMMMTMNGLISTGFMPWIYRSYSVPVVIDGKSYTTIRVDANNTNSGLIFRKFLRDVAGLDREEGDFGWPSIRLADVYLMYAEAANEASNGGATADRTDAIQYVNKVRRRGNLPPLAANKTSSYQNFFDAIEQERIVELFGEGQRIFDIRRWRTLEKIWGAPGGQGLTSVDTWNAMPQIWFRNADLLQYQRCYIYRIPLSERDRNPKLTQNTPWR